MSSIERIPIESREQWLELRRRDLTASIIAALWQLHPYETLAGLYAQKCGLVIPGPDAESPVIRRGQALEGVVAAEIGKLRPNWQIKSAGEYLRDPAIRLGATPDFYVTDADGARGVLQTKTVASSVYKRDWDEVNAPFWIALQTCTEMMLSGASFGAIGVLVIGDFAFEAHIYDVPRHAATEQRIRAQVVKFWDDVAAGREPAIDYERDSALISALYPHAAAGKIIDLTGDNELPEKLDRLEELKGVIKSAVAERDEIETEVKSKMKDAETAILNGWRLTLKEVQRKSYSVAASSYRQLRSRKEGRSHGD